MRGITLIEVLVSSVLSLLILSCAFLFLTTMTRASFKGTTFGQVETTDVVAFNRLVRDLQGTSSAGVSWNPDVGGAHLRCLCLQPIVNVTNAGQLRYANDSLIGYEWSPADQVLHRRFWVRGFSGLTLDPDVPNRLTPGQMQALGTFSGFQDTRVPGVKTFDLGSSVAPPNISSPLKPLLVVTLAGAHHQTETYRMQRTVVLKNAP